MTEIAVQQAPRLIRRKLSDAIGNSLLKSLTEPITNSDDSYGDIVRSESGNENAVFPISIFIDKQKRSVKIIDCAQGMTASDLKAKFKEYGAEKSTAYKGGNSRGIFGQGLSDVLFYHQDGKIKSIKNGEASICSFYWKRNKQYINIERIESSNNKLSKEWGLTGPRGTVIEFVLNSTSLHDYENLVKKLRVFYMLRLINNNDRRMVKLMYKDRKGTKESMIRYEFPKGDLVESKKFTLQFENYAPVVVDAQLHKSSVALPAVGEERENGFLVYDDKEAIYDQTFFELDNLPGTDKFFGYMKLSGAREIILKKINDPKHPEEILSDTRDGFNKKHNFYKQLASEVKVWLSLIFTEERRKRTNDGISETTIEKHRKAFEELNNLYKELTGEEMSGVILSKKKNRPIGGLQFARNNISITAGKHYGLHLTIDTRIVKPGTLITLKSSRSLIGFSPISLVVEEVPVENEGLLVKTIAITGLKARTVDTLEAATGKRKTSVVVSIVSEEVVYPEKGIVFSPEYVRTISEKDSILNLYVDLTLIKTGSKISFTSTNNSIVLKKTRISVPSRMRTTSKVAKMEVLFRGSKIDETGIIEASFGEYLAQCRVEIKTKLKIPPSGTGGLFNGFDFDDGLSENQQATLDSIEGSPTQGLILINSSHPINKYYFGDNPQKTEALQSRKAQLYISELILNESLGKIANDAHRKNLIPENYGPAIDIPIYIAQKKFEFGERIYSSFVEAEPAGLDVRRMDRLEEAKQESEMNETELLENMEDRQRSMVEMYFGLGEQLNHTLEEIAAKYGVTRERVRQIINKALAPARSKDEEEEDVYDEEVGTRDYILEEEKRLKSETELIIEKSAQLYGVNRDELSEHTRRANVVIPRQVAMYLLRTDMRLSFPSIGKLFDRDHTTVIHACNKVKEMIGKNAKVRNRVEKIQKLIENGNLR